MNLDPEPAELEDLKEQYLAVAPLCQRFGEAIAEHLGSLLERGEVRTASPVAFRVKTWGSIEGKVSQMDRPPDRIEDINDLVGVRVIVLFPGDVDHAIGVIGEAFSLQQWEDTSERLDPDRFGYGSVHLEITAPPAWMTNPDYQEFNHLSAEVQVRTASQHVWAAASHLLQYKSKEDVPRPLRRSITRVAALLETVDLELERLDVARQDYVHGIEDDPSVPLNVDSIRGLLDRHLPGANKDLVDGEDYAALLREVVAADVHSLKDLEDLIDRHSQVVMDRESKLVARAKSQLVPVRKR